MNISFKNMLTSFAVGVVLFSLIMLAVCTEFFDSTVDVRKNEKNASEEVFETITLSDAVVFEIANAEPGGLWAVFAIVDDSNQKIFLTPLYSEHLVPYKESFSHIATLSQKLGRTALIGTIKNFSGITIDDENFVKLSDIADMNALKAKLLEIGFSEYEPCDFPLVIKSRKAEDTREQIKLVDIDATVNKFKLSLGIK